MGWLRQKLGAAAAVAGRLLVDAGELLRAEPGAELDEDGEDGEPVPPQQPITEETRAIMSRRQRWRTGEMMPVETPPLQGSARERYARHPRRDSRRHRR